MKSRSLVAALAGCFVFLVAAGTAAAEAPHMNTPASISGSAVVGSQLTAHNGTWLYDNGTSCGPECSMSYQWERCDAGGSACASISGASGRFYTVQAADAGSRLRTMETMSIYDCGAHNTQTGTIECRWVHKQAPSGMTAVVPGSAAAGPTPPAAPAPPATPAPLAPLAPVITTAPTISGVPMVARQLTATRGTWSGSQPLTLALQWHRCDARGENCAPLGLSGDTYTVIPFDVGKTLRVVITASNGAGVRTAVSDPTAVVAALGPTADSPTIAAASVAAPHRLTIGSVRATPARFRSRGPLRVSLRVGDTRGFLVQGALVTATFLPATSLKAPAQVETAADGTATLVFARGAKLKRRVKALTVVLIARRPGDKLTSPRGAILRLRIPVAAAPRR